MATWSIVCAAFCLIFSVFGAPKPENDRLEDIVKQLETLKSVHEKEETTHYQILGIFEPSEAYFSQQQQQTEKRSLRRRYMKCIRFDRAARKCIRFAMVGIWK